MFRVELLEKEYSDLKTELDEEVRIHIDEIEQLSNESQIVTSR